MIKDLPDDDQDAVEDGPVKVAYHKAPVSEEPEESASQSISESAKSVESEEPEEAEENDPLDDETPVKPEEEEDDPDPLDDEEPEPAARSIGKPAESEEIEEENNPPKSNFIVDSSDDEDPAPATPKSASDPNEYYLQTVNAGEQPEWQQPKEELDVFSKPLGDGLIQYWAYPKSLGKTEDSIPNAEAVAIKHKSDNPVIIIDQIQDHLTPGCCLELILTKNGHAIAKTDSNLDNLEANITSLIDSAKADFGITVEHFISTSNVSPEVEKRLDDLEDAGTEEENPETTVAPHEFQQASVYNQDKSSIADTPILPPKEDRSKLAVLIPVVLLVALGVVVIFYRDKVLSVINPPKQEVVVTPTPTQTPTPTPTITIDKSKYKVRVLNGTPKTGAAGVLADKLKEKGWTIDKTGNATTSAVAQSTIRGKVGNDEAMNLLMEDVTDYEASISAVILPASDKADLEFVIGKK